MEIRQLRHLVAAIDEKSLIRAAEAVFITQPALTRSLQNLEHELGVELLLRLPRGVVATEAGEAVYRHANLVLKEISTIKADISLLAKGVTGNLKMGVSALFARYLVDDVIWQLATNQAELNMEITVGSFEDLVNDLVEGTLDVIFTNLPAVEMPEYLIVEPLGDLTAVFVASQDHPLAQKDLCELKDLETARWVITDQPHSTELFKQFFLSRGMATPVNLVRTNSIGLITSILQKGGFVSILPRHLVRESFAAEGLVELKVQTPIITRKFGLIYREDIAGRSALQPLLSALRNACINIESGSL
ncbi:MAG: DNA-binding transcriptional LysR family regulator [Paraglaciecola sp.]|jgi:DNA-binding transcriptional LysR family regulator